MSVLGPLSTSATNIAASILGTLRNPVEADRIKAEQAIQKMHADIVQLSEPGLADELESELSHGQVADRDADGRLPWTFGEQRSDAEDQPEPQQRTESADPDGRGQTLDLNA